MNLIGLNQKIATHLLFLLSKMDDIPRQLLMYLPPARTHDPKTSKISGRIAATRGTSHRVLLLAEFAKAGITGLTSDEAGERSGLRERRACYWKRISDLEAEGLLEPTGDLRPGFSGELQRVHRITQKGMDVFKQKEP